MAPHPVHLLRLATEGFRVLGRLRSVWALAAAGLLLTVIALWAPLPLKEPGIYSLGSIAVIDQTLIILLVGVHVVHVRPARPRAWWPVSPEIAVAGRALGMIAFVGVFCGGLVLIQYLVVAAAGDLETRAFLSGHGDPTDQRYLALWVLLVAYGAILLAWGQTLRYVLPPGTTLISLLVLAFSGYFLHRLAGEHSGLEALVFLLPDLAATAPANATTSSADLLRIALYSAVHSVSAWMFGAILLRLRMERGTPVESEGRGA